MSIYILLLFCYEGKKMLQGWTVLTFFFLSCAAADSTLVRDFYDSEMSNVCCSIKTSPNYRTSVKLDHFTLFSYVTLKAISAKQPILIRDHLVCCAKYLSSRLVKLEHSSRAMRSLISEQARKLAVQCTHYYCKVYEKNLDDFRPFKQFLGGKICWAASTTWWIINNNIIRAAVAPSAEKLYRKTKEIGPNVGRIELSSKNVFGCFSKAREVNSTASS